MIVDTLEASFAFLRGKKVRRTTWPEGWIFLRKRGIVSDELNVYRFEEGTCYLSPVASLEKSGFNKDKLWEIKED